MIGPSLVFEKVANNVFYAVQERDHHSFDVLSAGGEDAQMFEEMLPLMNQHENLDVEFNSLEDMVSICIHYKNQFVIFWTLTKNFYLNRFQYRILEVTLSFYTAM